MLVILISLEHGMVYKKSICLPLTKEVNKVFQIDAKEGLPPFPLPEAPWYSWRASSVVITCRSHFDHVFNTFLALDFRLCLLLGFQKAKLQDDFKKHKIAFYKHTSVVLNLFRVTKILDPLLEKSTNSIMLVETFVEPSGCMYQKPQKHSSLLITKCQNWEYMLERYF